MRRILVLTLLAACMSAPAAPAGAATNAQGVAALQVALRAKGHYRGPVDGIAGPLTKAAVVSFQQRRGLPSDGRVGPRTRAALGTLGRPLLGRRPLWVGRVGWDVSALEFRLSRHGLARAAIDGRFTAATAAALRRFQQREGLPADGIAGPRTYRALAGAREDAPAASRSARTHVVRAGEGFYAIAALHRVDAVELARANGLRLTSVLVPGQRLQVPGGTQTTAAKPVSSPRLVHVVRAGESFFSIAERYGVSPFDLARENGVGLDRVIVPGLRLRLPAGARAVAALPGSPPPSPSRDAVRAQLDQWAATYGVDARLARALAWMESGYQNHVVSPVGARGVMQLLPETWDFVETVLIGARVPETYDGNVRVGVRYLRWQLDQFGGDVRLALAGWYQGARAVRERGLFDDTKEFVRIVLALYGNV